MQKVRDQYVVEGRTSRSRSRLAGDRSSDRMGAERTPAKSALGGARSGLVSPFNIDKHHSDLKKRVSPKKQKAGGKMGGKRERVRALSPNATLLGKALSPLSRRMESESRVAVSPTPQSLTVRILKPQAFVKHT